MVVVYTPCATASRSIGLADSAPAFLLRYEGCERLLSESVVPLEHVPTLPNAVAKLSLTLRRAVKRVAPSCYRNGTLATLTDPSLKCDLLIGLLAPEATVVHIAQTLGDGCPAAFRARFSPVMIKRIIRCSRSAKAFVVLTTKPPRKNSTATLVHYTWFHAAILPCPGRIGSASR
jgi:hypothetical protein